MVYRGYMNKKGITLETAVMLILVALSLGIIIILLLTSGLLSSLESIICTSLTTGGMWIRGLIVQQVWSFVWIFIGIVGAIMLIFGTTCRAFPVGTAACAIAFGVFTGVIIITANSLTSSLPLFSCPNPTIMHGPFSEECTTTSSTGISKEVLFKEVADRSVDCWNMYTRGKYDPLSGREPPNPVTCFVIDFKLKPSEAVSVREIVDWMADNNYSNQEGIPYIEKAGWAIIMQNNSNVIWDKNIMQGRMFIKYGDDISSAQWASADCEISGSFRPPDRWDYYLDFFGNSGSVQSCQQTCMDTFRQDHCPGISNSCIQCVQELPSQFTDSSGTTHICRPENCVPRNYDTSMYTCLQACLDLYDDSNCPETCNQELWDNCGPGNYLDLWECNAACKGTTPSGLPGGRDYVYWCFEKNITCDDKCNPLIAGGKCLI